MREPLRELRGARVLVTGAGGFIGSHLTRRLLEVGADVHAMSPAVSTQTPPRLAAVAADVTLVEANVTDRTSMEHVAAAVAPEYVLHLAAFTHVGKSFIRVDECLQTNVQGTVNLLQALDGDYERFVYVGTSEIYGPVEVPFREDRLVDPVSPYAVSKYAGERYCRMLHAAYGWPIVCLRPFNAYGPAQTVDRVVPEIILTGLRGGELRMTAGTQTREFNFVTDIADAMVAALTGERATGEVINVCSGRDIAIRDLATTILGLMDDPIEPRFGALDHRPTEIWRMVGDPSKGRELLGWEPEVDLEAGLERTIAWYRDHADQLHTAGT